MRFRHGETVQRVPYLRTDENAHGDGQTVIYGAAVDVFGAGFDPGGTTDTDDARVSLPTLYLRFDQPAHELDQWRVRGRLYAVEGDVARMYNPFTGWEAGTVIKLRRAAG